MFHVETRRYAHDLPFDVFPYRAKSGRIYYPPEVNGMYMQDHVIAAFKHYDYFEEAGRINDYGCYRGNGAKLEIVSGWIFHPATDNKPLAWIAKLFEYRASLLKSSAIGQVIKLGLNSIYGKFAESVGDPGRPPLFVSPYFAAAITAGTQRRVVEAALTNPDKVVMFATDGVYSTILLDVHVPDNITLGGWEHSVVE